MSFASLISLNGPSSSNARLSAISSNATVIAVWVTRLTIPEAMSLAFWLAFNQPSPTISPKIKYIIKKCLPYLCVYRAVIKNHNVCREYPASTFFVGRGEKATCTVTPVMTEYAFKWVVDVTGAVLEITVHPWPFF